MKTIGNYTFFYKDKIAQWNISTFIDDNNIPYNCVEQFMMCSKARLFKDKESYDLILEENDPSKQQKLGRKIKNFDEKIWEKNKIKIVYQGNFYKFTQNKDLYDILKSTKNTTLVEASPSDSIWGIGMSIDNPMITNEKEWKGLNLLGETLTRLRDKI